MIEIRKAVTEDIADIAELERLTFAMPWSEESLRHDIEDNPIARVVVALLDGEFAGYADLWMVAGEGQVSNIAVSEGRRRSGVGRALLSKLIEISHLEGCEELFLEVRPSNDAAIGLYTQFGFRPIGERPGYYLDNGESAIIMNLEL